MEAEEWQKKQEWLALIHYVDDMRWTYEEGAKEQNMWEAWEQGYTNTTLRHDTAFYSIQCK